MGVPEAEVRMGEAMYENTNRGVVVGSGTSMSNEFQVNIDLRQDSAYKPIPCHLSNGTNQQKDQHDRCSEEGHIRSRLVIVAEHREEWQGALQ